MATLVDNIKAWNQIAEEPFMDYMNRMDAVLEELMRSGKVVKFPIADGYAFYHIVSEKPFKLRHIPAGDAWEIPYSHIRGLRLADVKAMLKREKALNIYKPFYLKLLRSSENILILMFIIYNQI